MAAMELRVHGVSGTPPEDLLDRPLVEQVAGDAVAGFYVPRLADERTDAAPNVLAPRQPDPPELVGYSWGGLTSGAAGRAFWLLLLPFTFINIAPRARPDSASKTGGFARSIWYLSRVLALTLTVLFTLAGVGVGLDLIGWQCSGTDACAKTMPHWVSDQDLSVGRTLLVGAVVPVVMLGLLWLVSARTENHYERTVADVRAYRRATSPGDEPDANAIEVGLSSPLMWQNATPVRRLRAVHMQCGFSAVLWSVLAPTELRYLGVIPGAVVLYALIALFLPAFTGHGASRRWSVASRVVWGALAMSGVVVAVGLACGWTEVRSGYLSSPPGTPRAGRGGLPFFDAFVLVVSALAVGLLVVLIAAVMLAALRRSAPAPVGPHAALPPGMFGLTAAALAALGVFLAAAFTSGIYVYAATFLHTGSPKPSFHELSTIYGTVTVPPTVAVATLAYTHAVAALLVLLAIAVPCLVTRWWTGSGYDAQAQADYADPMPVSPDAEKRWRKIRRDMYLGSLVDRAPWLVGPLVLVGLVIVGGWGIYLGLHLRTRRDHLLGTGDGWSSRNFGSGLGAYLVVITVVGLVSVGALAFRIRATRRVVGILWDVASFWPRACHPLAPPCYAERAVPDLVTFITHRRVSDQSETVVLAAHSQGTVISAATIFQLDAYDRGPGGEREVNVMPGVAFLSFGCVLRRLYGRYFPVYFGPAELARLQGILSVNQDLDTTPRWINLWRYTDYLGGQVTTGPPQRIPAGPVVPPSAAVIPEAPPVTGPGAVWEWHAPDPPRFDRDDGDTTFSSPQRHSNFWADRSGYFQLAARRLVQQTEVRRTEIGTS